MSGYYEQGGTDVQPCGPDCTGRPDCAGCIAYDRYCQEGLEEQERLEATPRFNGHQALRFDSECEQCGQVKPVLYDQTACTLGYPGHPGAEWTTFGICAECLA